MFLECFLSVLFYVFGDIGGIQTFGIHTEYIGNTPRILLEYFLNTLGILWMYLGKYLGIFWEYIRNTLRIHTLGIVWA